MVVQLHYYIVSQPSRSILMFLKSNNIKHEAKVVDIFKGEARTPEYLKMNPKHTVPCLKDDAFVVTESSAAVIYLANKYKCAAHWYPSDVKKRAMVHELLDWRHTTIRKHGTAVFRDQALYKYMGMPVMSAEELETAYKDLDEAMGTLAWYLGDKPFLCGADITIADLFIANEVVQATLCEKDIYENHPQIKAWMGRVQEKLNPAWDEALGEVKTVLAGVQGK